MFKGTVRGKHVHSLPVNEDGTTERPHSLIVKAALVLQIKLTN